MRTIKLPYFDPRINFNPKAIETVTEAFIGYDCSGEDQIDLYTIELTTFSGKVYTSPRFLDGKVQVAMGEIMEALKKAEVPCDG